MPGRSLLVLASFFVFLAIHSTANAQRDPSIPHAQDRPPGPSLSPSEAIAKMTVPPGFSVELVASEPDLVNPVAMTIDERGRFWITESLEYPRKSAGPGRDRVKILEDTDGDGKADKFTIFAEGLNIPSGIAVGAGGVWVANSPDILFLKDTDGDGKADTKEVVITGFGRYDTHELPNSLTWGPDGYLYGWNGVFNPAKIDYRGKHYEFTCAVFRIDPKTRDFEVFCEGTSNPWGITWDKEGAAFASACVIDHLWHLTETGYYHRQGGPYPPFTWKLESIVDHKHQKAAYCGITYFDSDTFPEKYRERLFMGNIHAGGINVDRLERNGATYRGKTEDDFLQANDAWFMPVVQKVGPDGSLYVLDWYDRYHCYQDANRDPNGIDRLKGRLYRVKYKDTPRSPKFDMATEPDDQLIGRLSSPNIYFRETAQRILCERDHADARVKLQTLAADSTASRKARLQALWTLIGTGRLDPGFLKLILKDADPTFRAWGVRAAGNIKKVAPEIRDLVASLAIDPAPDVRVQVAIASRKIDGMDALPILYEIISKGADDPLIPHIVWQNLHPMLEDRAADFVKILDLKHQEKVVLTVVENGVPGKKFETEPFVFDVDLAKSLQLGAILPRVIDRLLSGAKVQPKPAADVLKRLMMNFPNGPRLEPARAALGIIADRLRPGVLSQADRSKLIELIGPAMNVPQGTFNDSLTLDMALVAANWRDPVALQTIGMVLKGSHNSDGQRLKALDALIVAGLPTILETIEPLLVERQAGSTKFRGEIIASLGRIDSARVAEIVLKAYPSLEPELQPKAIELLTQRAVWTTALIAAVESKLVPASMLNVNQIRKLASSRDRAIAERVKAVWGTVRESRNPAREQVIERIKVTLNEARGDARAGQVVFKNVCGQCHKIYGEGQEVGPEITLNGRGSYDQLLSNVFDPNLVIGPAYQATTIATSDGRVLTGLVVEDSPRRIVLKLQGGKVETIERSTIEESKLSAMSLMPEGLESQVTPKELADLFAFITLDKPPGDPNARTLPGTPSGIRK